MPAGSLPSIGSDPSAASKGRSTVPFFIGCCLLLLCMELIGVRTMKDLSRGPDFRSFYAAGLMVRTEPSRLYDIAEQKRVQDEHIFPTDVPLPFFHPSYEAVAYAPLSFLPYRPAYYTSIVVNVLLIIASFFVARPLFSAAAPWLQARPGLLFFLYFPLMIAVWEGQDSILFLLLAALTWRELERGNDASAGVALALALFRFQLAVPIAILLAARRGWRFFTAFAATGAAVTLLSVALVGRSGVVSLLHLLSASSLTSDQGALAQRAMAIYPRTMPNLLGLLYGCGTRLLAPGVAFAVVALVSAAVFLWALLRIRRVPQQSTAFALAILCAVLISYHMYLHDASLLLIPMALLAHRVRPELLLACYWLPLVTFLFAGAEWYFLLALPILALLVSASVTERKIQSSSTSTEDTAATVEDAHTGLTARLIMNLQGISIAKTCFPSR